MKKLEPEYTLLFKDVSLCIKFLLGCEVKLKTVGAIYLYLNIFHCMVK